MKTTCVPDNPSGPTCSGRPWRTVSPIATERAIGPERRRWGAHVLDRVTGNDPAVTDYIFVEAMAKCPRCMREIGEKTLVEVE